MDSTGMTALAEALAAQDSRVVRFEFAYMATRRTEGSVAAAVSPDRPAPITTTSMILPRWLYRNKKPTSTTVECSIRAAYANA